MRSVGEGWIASGRSSLPKMPPVHLDFFGAPEPNALAFMHKGQRFIGVTAEAAIGMGQLFLRALSDRRVLTHVGDPSTGVEYPPLAPPLLPALGDIASAGGITFPRDYARKEYCKRLTFLASGFLVFHELGHIVNGHVDWLANRRHAPVIAELRWMPGSVEESIELQALELDADAFAFSQVESLSHQWAENGACKLPHLQTYEEHLFAGLFAAFSFFRLFGDEPLTGADLYKSSHPPIRARLGNVWDVLVRQAVGAHGRDLFPTLDLVAAAAEAVEQAFHCLTGQPVAPRIRYVEGRVLPAGQEHKVRLVRRWNGGLCDELLQYAFGVPIDYAEPQPAA
jgi:hypothetical protein